jgi:D-alanyl-D-alanine dipeptidase
MAQRSRYPCQDAGVDAVDQRSAGIVMMADPQVSAIPVRGDRYLDAVRAANPDWDAQRLRVAASRYVSPPELAPHSAGAAVDLTLCTDDYGPREL